MPTSVRKITLSNNTDQSVVLEYFADGTGTLTVTGVDLDPESVTIVYSLNVREVNQLMTMHRDLPL